jgi:hypothetical protein
VKRTAPTMGRRGGPCGDGPPGRTGWGPGEHCRGPIRTIGGLDVSPSRRTAARRAQIAAPRRPFPTRMGRARLSTVMWDYAARLCSGSPLQAGVAAWSQAIRASATAIGSHAGIRLVVTGRQPLPGSGCGVDLSGTKEDVRSRPTMTGPRITPLRYGRWRRGPRTGDKVPGARRTIRTDGPTATAGLLGRFDSAGRLKVAKGPPVLQARLSDNQLRGGNPDHGPSGGNPDHGPSGGNPDRGPSGRNPEHGPTSGRRASVRPLVRPPPETS